MEPNIGPVGIHSYAIHTDRVDVDVTVAYIFYVL